MSQGIAAALPAQSQQASALDRGARGKASGGEAEPFSTVLGQSQGATRKGAERTGGPDADKAGMEKSSAENGAEDTADAEEASGRDDTREIPDASSLLVNALSGAADKVALAGGRSAGATGAGAHVDGGARPPHPQVELANARMDGRTTAWPEGQGLRVTLMNGAAAEAPTAGKEGRSVEAAARTLLELASGTGQTRNNVPAAALQQSLAVRGGERPTPGTMQEVDGKKRAAPADGEQRVRAAAPVPETPQMPEAKDTEQSSRRIEGRAETARTESRQENAFRSMQNAADGKPLDIGGSKVAMLGAQNAPAPAAPSPGSTSSALVGALDADSSWKSILSEAATIAGGSARRGGEVLQSVRIQLQPASLGTVTARLSVQGDQMAVDLQVETTEARQRLSTDSDAIVKSLRALGYEVDRVTVQQVQQPGTGQPAQNAPGRGTSFQGESGHGGASGERSRSGQGNQPGSGGDSHGGAAGRGQANAGRNGLYI